MQVGTSLLRCTQALLPGLCSPPTDTHVSPQARAAPPAALQHLTNMLLNTILVRSARPSL